MANSKLLGKTFPLPDKILSVLSTNLKKFSDKRDSKGFNRAIFLLQRRYCTYEQLKRMKNYFDSITDENYNETEYLLNGGDLMKKWVEFKLQEARRSVVGQKTARRNAGMENQFRADSDDSMSLPSPNIRSTPDFMGSQDLLAEVKKIITLNKQIN